MATKLKDVVIWKARARPGARQIPPHLKLAILSRGRIRLETDSLKWLIHEVGSDRARWINHLSRPLGEIFDDLPVTVELFQKQLKSMSVGEINEALAGYLTLRKNKHLRNCFALLYIWTPHLRRQEVEQNLDIDLTRLFTRPRVYARPRPDDPYILLVYVCIPRRITHFLQSGPPPLPPLSDPMPPLDARTARNAEMNLRSGPSTNSNKLGEQDGHEVRVKVLEKAYGEGYTWYRVRLEEAMRIKKGAVSLLKKGTEVWMAKDGLQLVVAPWALFRHELSALEASSTVSSQSAAITRLRQRTHTKNLPFDRVIGTEPGDVYLDDLPNDTNSWQMAKDYNAVRAPDGRPVDINHVLVGLDVLGRVERHVDFATIPIGSNWAAATWSGDAGAGAADMQLKSDKYWERRNSRASFNDRVGYYFETRAPDWDLLGDVDAWRLIHMLNQQNPTLDAVLATYYEATFPGAIRTLVEERSAALENFLAHYGFTYVYDEDIGRYPALVKQRAPVRRILYEIGRFTQVWLYRRKPALLAYRQSGKADRKIYGAMAAQFLYWMEYAAIENGATIPPSQP